MQVTCLQRLCIMEGIDEWKIEHALRNDGSVPRESSKAYTHKYVNKYNRLKYRRFSINAHL